MVAVLVWNIEMYGAKFTSNSLADKMSMMIRDQMIATIIQQAAPQVVMVQEVRKTGIARLPVVMSLLKKLGQTDWNFDVVEGAFSSDTVNFPQYLSVCFSQNANNEGYAVLWRGDAVFLEPITYQNGDDTVIFKQSYGMNSTNYSSNADHVVALVNEGYTFTWVPDGNRLSITFDGTADAPGMGFIGFPYSNLPNIVDDPQKNSKILSRSKTRRPAVISVKSNGVSFPVVAYHAPVHLNSSIAGTIAALVAKELFDMGQHGYEVNAVRAFAGDLNLKMAFNNLSASAIATAAGLTKTMINDDGSSPRTMVRPFDYLNAEYNDETYLETSRDYAFGSSVVNSVGIYDPVSALFKNGTLATALRSNDTIMNLMYGKSNCVSYLNVPGKDLQGGAWPDVLTTYFGLKDGTVSEDDQWNICSVFYRLFVSDHIPVMITLA